MSTESYITSVLATRPEPGFPDNGSPSLPQVEPPPPPSKRARRAATPESLGRKLAADLAHDVERFRGRIRALQAWLECEAAACQWMTNQESTAPVSLWLTGALLTLLDFSPNRGKETGRAKERNGLRYRYASSIGKHQSYAGSHASADADYGKAVGRL